jgi:hypothetical protein
MGMGELSKNTSISPRTNDESIPGEAIIIEDLKINSFNA